uniref:BTB domain-containing protein n=1 Tax=Arcella intermedia TaxID=1963864 RepID=A0A6B2LJA1_9EUKA|eukprot:TRINITY_DN9428_c0_g1_i1.p1 TRINITY_DN9428_c0_g1~~TRINITY_DN9428_c0_g1_i1.p1  ORF type:complete len:200 (+),score=50.48 TRINITY_DN9428_c0_g1_i1:608-1207(+)
MKFLLNNKQFSDFQILIHNNNIYTHKNILASKSLYFQEMFLNDPEKQSWEIENMDIDLDTFSIIMEFIYSGDLNITPQNFEKVNELGLYFKILGLTKFCERKISKMIDSNNFIEIYELSERVNSNYIHQQCILFSKRRHLPDLKDKMKAGYPQLDTHLSRSPFIPQPHKHPSKKRFNPIFLWVISFLVLLFSLIYLTTQ